MIDVVDQRLAPSPTFLRKPLNFKKPPVLVKIHGDAQRRIVALEPRRTQTYPILTHRTADARRYCNESDCSDGVRCRGVLISRRGSCAGAARHQGVVVGG